MAVDLIQAYKPLRNHLSRVALLESLGVIRAYMQHLQFRRPLPSDIEVPRWFLNARTTVEKKVHEWGLDMLAREVLINAREVESTHYLETLRKWSYFAGAVNKLKSLEDFITGLYPDGAILHELLRIAHRQFGWQRPPDKIWIGRYFKLFSHPLLAPIVRRKLELEAVDLYMLGFACAGVYFDELALNYPPNISIPGLDRRKLDAFLHHFSLPLDEMRKRARDGQQLNEKYAYTLNPLRIHPMIRMTVRGKDSLVAPIPTFLIWRFTEGVYYELTHEPDFGPAFGRAFQDYVGEVGIRAIEGSPVSMTPEGEYRLGRDRKDTVDWIFEDTSGLLFVECKTKRLTLTAKTELLSMETLDGDLQKLADFIVQVYKSVRDYRDEQYLHFPFRSGKPLYPLVVTLEEWHTFGPLIQGALDAKVTSNLQSEQLPAEWLTEMPYLYCSVADFELLMQIIARRSIDAVLRAKGTDAEYRRWEMGSYLNHNFPVEVKEARVLFREFSEVLDSRIA